MNKSILFLIILAIALGCKPQPDTFEFTISGKIVGQESGQLFFTESNRAGDEISIPFENHKFEYKGTSSHMYLSLVLLDRNFQKGVLPIVIEPGEIILELDVDSIAQKSKVLKGTYNIANQKAQQEFTTLFSGADFKSQETKEKIIDWLKVNNENYMTINLLSSWESFEDFLPLDVLGELMKGIKDKKLKKSREYIQLYSIWLSKKDSLNNVGKKATNFRLPNIDKEMISFNSVAKNKLTFVERSGSWCGNSTRISRELKPIYEKYNENGFEIITIVPELKLDRWEKWINKENFPWINLIELEDDVAKCGKRFSSMLFKGLINPNYLVDQNGEIIATNLSSDALNEIMMQKFEPEEYQKYIDNKWNLPEETYILDKKEAVNSFDELVQKLSGKPFLIDCWATWCSPCLEEFKHNKELKTFLKSKNMEIVYFNFDQSIDESKWLNTIKKHELKGYHLRLNNSFSSDLAKIGFSGSLPAYMIVDSNGEVVEKNAFRPSQKEKLYNQIENGIKKNVP